MAVYDVFNGDADGICALLQLRQVSPKPSTLVTGVKRDISLLKNVTAEPGDHVNVLDVSLDKNRADLERILNEGATVFYADHHYAGEIPSHALLSTLINLSPEVSTSALINGHLKGQRAGWAIVGCYGDNLDSTAGKIANTLGAPGDLSRWKELGVLINYNGYGASIDDLHFAPADLYARLLPHNDPQHCLDNDPDLIQTLSAAYGDDMRQAEMAPRIVDEGALSVVAFPDAPWARRVSGVYGNFLANNVPDRAHAVLTEIPKGYLVSVRAPLNARQGADELCRQFPTGGGRAAAAGINELPTDRLDDFVEAMRKQFA